LGESGEPTENRRYQLNKEINKIGRKKLDIGGAEEDRTPDLRIANGIQTTFRKTLILCLKAFNALLGK